MPETNKLLQRDVFLTYKDVTVYHSYKGKTPFTWWYSLYPTQPADSEGGPDDFDVRRIGFKPSKDPFDYEPGGLEAEIAEFIRYKIDVNSPPFN